MQTKVFLVGVVVPLLVPFAAQARITGVQITTRGTAFGGFSWPGVGQYEKIVGTASGELDPSDPKNAVIVDIALAKKDGDAVVKYSFDFYILKPIDATKGAHKVMYEPPNRGGKTWGTLGRFPAGGNDPGSVTNPAILANAFFMPRGYTMVWSGWDKAAGTDNSNFNTTISLPVAHNLDGSTITGPAYEYIVVANNVTSFTLNYPAADVTQSAKLTHRVHLNDVPQPVAWEYTSTAGPAAGTKIRLAGGAAFVPNDIYEFSYTAKDPTVNGVGFAAVRDWVAFLRYDTSDANPLEGDIQQVYTEVVSQPGRLLNDFRHLGFNQAENGKKVFDGHLQWIAAGDGINMNYRFSQPGRTERNRQDHLYAEGVFPFANVMTFDPITKKTDSRYKRCEATGTCSFGMEIYSANEYWVKAASLLHTDPTGRRDLEDSPFARNYFISSHQHGTGNAASKGNCQQFQNPLDSAPVQRALFVALDEWATGRRLPPHSRVPALRDRTFAPPLPQSGMGFPDLPGVTYTGLKTTRYLFDYGRGYYETGIPTINPPTFPTTRPDYQDDPQNGPIYPSFIPKTDRDGNDIAGVRLVDVSVPLATYTGWALRAGPQANDGCEAAGQYIPFPRTKADRLATGDPRASVQERYGSLDRYADKAVQALRKMVKQRLLLWEDFGSELSRVIAAAQAAGLTPREADDDEDDDDD